MPKRKIYLSNNQKKKKKQKTTTANNNTINNSNSSNNNNAVDFGENKNFFPILKIFPAEVWWPILTRLTLKEVSNLSKTSRFFYQKIRGFLKDDSFLKNQFNKLLQKTIITLGNFTTFVLTPEGSVYGCGNNYHGELGFGDTNNRLVPEKLPFGSVAKVAAGHSYTFFQLKDGHILCCGKNSYGELGLGKEDKILTPTNLTFPSDMNIKNLQIITSRTGLCSFIISEEGKIWGTGSNFWGQLSFKNKDNHYTFTTLPIEGVKQVISNGVHTFFLKDKEIWGCGNNEGQMELEYPLKRQILNIQKLSSKPVKKIISGFRHTIIQTEDGIWGSGANHGGQLGLGENIKNSNLVKLPIESVRVREIFSGFDSTFFLLENGQVWACGRNSFGELGLGNKGSSVYQPKQLPIEPNQVVEIIAGFSHTLFLLKDGRILGCGCNKTGQLGLGSGITQLLTPQELPELTKCLGLHGLYKKIEVMNPANVNKNSNQQSEKSNAELNSSEFQNNNNHYKP